MRRGRPRVGAVALVSAVSLFAAPSRAMAAAAPQSYAYEEEGGFGVRGFVHGAFISFDANRSFEAVVGDTSGSKFGAGGQLLFPNGIFVEGAIERYRESGSRAFLFDEELFPLGIDDTVTVTPITVTGGYRFVQLGRVVPYVGGGVGSYRLEEESEFAAPDEIVDDRFTGYHVLGGVEFIALRRDAFSIAAAAEVEYATVPDALGTGGLSAEFGEDNLGGTTARFKLHFGFGGPREPVAEAPSVPPSPVSEPPPSAEPPRQPPPPEMVSEPPDVPTAPSPSETPSTPERAPAPTEPDLARGSERLRQGDLLGASQSFRRHLRLNAADQFTIAVGLYCDVANVEQQVANAGGADELIVLNVTTRGRSCFGVYWGLYETRDEAQDALSSIPTSMRAPGQTPVDVWRLLRR